MNIDGSAFLEGLNPVSFNILTEIVRPTAGAPQDEANYAPASPPRHPWRSGWMPTRILTGGYPSRNYVGSDGLVDWTKRHVCIQIDHHGSHKQLWVLSNGTAGLHNFHIHQMKFRLATVKELRETYFIEPPPVANDCPGTTRASASSPNMNSTTIRLQTTSIRGRRAAGTTPFRCHRFKPCSS